MSRLSPRRSRASIARRLAASALAAVAFAAAPPPAAAGEYHVYACKTPQGHPAPADRWEFDASLYAGTSSNTCAGGGGLSVGLGSMLRRNGDEQRFSLTVPAELAIKRAVVQRQIWMVPGISGDIAAMPVARVNRDNWTYNAPFVLENCQGGWGCVSYSVPPGWAHQVAFEFGAEPTRFLGFGVFCGGDPAGYCQATESADRARIQLDSADLTLEDLDAPDVSGVGGSLTAAGARSGVETLNFTAADGGAGVYQALVYVNGQEVRRTVLDANGGRCVDAGALASSDLEFKHVQPCARSLRPHLELDTRSFPEGRPQVTVVARDAAGNTTTVFSERVSIDNVPGPAAVAAPSITGAEPAGGLRPGDPLTAVPGAWTGPALQFSYRWQRGSGNDWNDIAAATGAAYTVARDDIGQRLRVVVRATNSDGAAEQVSAPTGEVQSGATVVPQSIVDDCAQCNGAGGDASTGQLVVDREQRSIEVGYAASVVITGRLVDAEGRPIGGAAVDVFERLELTGAAWRQVATITTDAQGGYSYRPKSTGSRTVRFAYAARRGGADYRATRDVTVAVRGKLTGSAVKRVVRAGSTLRLKGRLTVEALPKGGTWVEVQVLDGGSWRTIGTRRTSSRGLWKFNHRLRRSRGVTFRFRARLRVTGDVPSAATTSPTIKVRVR